MDRRTLLAAAGATLAALPLGATMPGSRVGATDVQTLSAAVESMRAVARSTGGYVPALASLAERGEELAKLPATDAVRGACLRVDTEAWTVAGWTAFDGGRRATAWGHYDRALKLTEQTGDAAAASKILYFAGTLESDAGRFNEALRLYQLAAIRLDLARLDGGDVLNGPMAHAYAAIGRGDLAKNYLAKSLDVEQGPFLYANTLTWVADTYARMGKFDNAVDNAKTAVNTPTPGARSGRRSWLS